MCGLITVASKAGTIEWQKRKNFLEQALQVGVVRGDHATGLLLCPKEKPTPAFSDIVQIKKPVDGYTFTQLTSVTRLLQNVDHYKYIIGHNRQATHGRPQNYSGAHPFVSGKIGLVHNGTLTNVHGKVSAKFREFEVDSAWMCWAFNEYGERETLENISGTFAVIWHNKENDKLRFVRNDERTLVYAYSVDKQNFFMTSEVGMLAWLAWRNGIELDKITQVTPGVVYTLDKELNLTRRKIDFFKPKSIMARDSHPYYKHGVHTTLPFNSPTRQRKITRPGNAVAGKFAKPKILSGPEVDHVLQSMGLKLGDQLEWAFASMYKSNETARHGRATGVMLEQPNYEVAQYNVRDGAYEGKYILKGTILGMEHHFLNYHTVVVADCEETGKKDPYWTVLTAVNNQKGRKSKKVVRLALPSDNGTKIMTNKRHPAIKILDNKGNLKLLPPPKEADLPGKPHDLQDMQLRILEGQSTQVIDDDVCTHLGDWSAIDSPYEVRMVQGPEGLEIPLTEYIQLTKYGCSYCGNPISASDCRGIEWTYQRHPICQRCDYEHAAGRL